MRKVIVKGNRVIPCQDDAPFKDGRATQRYLKLLLQVLKAIEQATGYLWRVTSFVRESASHQKGISLDIAPDIADDSKQFYSVFQRSDPVLYKRERLLRALQWVAANYNCDDHDIGIFIEPDHLHLQIFEKSGPVGEIRIIKWKQLKNCYHDTAERITLPLIKT